MPSALQSKPLSKPEFFVSRIRGIKLRSQKRGNVVEVEVGGHVEPLTPLATRALIRALQESLAYAEGRR